MYSFRPGHGEDTTIIALAGAPSCSQSGCPNIDRGAVVESDGALPVQSQSLRSTREAGSRVVPAGGDPQRPAHRGHLVVRLLSLHEPEHRYGGPAGLLGEEGRCFYQDLSLGLEHPDPPAQAGELLALIRGDALPLALVDLGLADPRSQLLHGHPEVSRDLLQGATRADQADGLGSELRRVRRSRSASHSGLLSPEPQSQGDGPPLRWSWSA